MKVYFIPGLGADKRVFRHIQLPEGFEMVHLEWLPPQKNEALEQYARRMAAGIDMQSRWSVVGLSFGGMLAAEICRQFSPAQTILIASIASHHNLPTYYKYAAPLGLHRFLPVSLFKNASLAKRIFTTETSEDKSLLRKIISESDPSFIRWALGAILQWRGGIQRSDLHHTLYHIHGTRDNLLPIRYVQPTHPIEGGGHLMVMNRATEINRALQDILENVEM